MPGAALPSWVDEQSRARAGAAACTNMSDSCSSSDDGEDSTAAAWKAPVKLQSSEPQTLRRKACSSGGSRAPTRPSPSRALEGLPRQNITGALLRSESVSIRSTCKHADLVVERAERIHDELEHARFCALGGDTEAPADAMHDGTIAYEYHYRFLRALEEMEAVELDDVPDALAFSDRTLLAEVASTRDNLRLAIERARHAATRMEERMSAARQAEEDAAQHGGSSMTVDDVNDLNLLRQLDGLSTTFSPQAAPTATPTAQTDASDPHFELPEELALD